MVRFARPNAVPLAVRWTVDGRRLVVACTDGHVRVVDPDTVEVLHDAAALDGWAYALAVHPSDAIVLVGGREGQLAKTALPRNSP